MTNRKNAVETDTRRGIIYSYYKKLQHSIWLFPAILTIILLLLTAFKIHGSSIGIYSNFMGGDGSQDSNLLLNTTRSIRSDEWLVVSQLTFAQENAGYPRVNTNIGQGQDMSLVVDVPYQDWSVIFKPQNLGFFALPFDNAFAFRWWLLSYLLILSCYFFILALLPGKKLLAATISLAFLFSPFIQWWYTNGTLGSLAYSLFAATILMHVLREGRWRSNVGWTILLGYVLACFAIILYPPFQIPCALVLTAFSAGYIIERWKNTKTRDMLKRLTFLAAAGVVALGILLAFLYTRQDAVQAITDTVYPGQRVVLSGGYDIPHLVSGHLSVMQQFGERAAHYSVAKASLFNQSESSNFILLLPYLFIPGVFLLIWRYAKKKEIDWPLLATSVLFVVIIVRLYLPYFNDLFNLLQLGQVPHTRLIIGLGLLSLIHLILIIRSLAQIKDPPLPNHVVVRYSLLCLLATATIGWYVVGHYPGFVSLPEALLLAIPLPVIVYLLLSKHFVAASLVFLAFSGLSSAGVNPLYRGTDVITQTPVSQEIRQIVQQDDSRWATENFIFENFAVMNGARSLSAVYTYPQLELWRGVDPTASEDIYNRYAHTFFRFDRDPEANNSTQIVASGTDSFNVVTEPCSALLRDADVRYLLVNTQLASDATCAQLFKTVDYPALDFYIYKLNF